jgi:hypothetical protein
MSALEKDKEAVRTGSHHCGTRNKQSFKPLKLEVGLA